MRFEELRRFKREERGVSAILVVISLVGILGAAVLAVDGTAIWATKRNLVTGTDAGALAAARLYALGLADPCTSAGQSAGEAEAKSVLLDNNSQSQHDSTSTPGGYSVTMTGNNCASGTGHVQFDGRLKSVTAFSGIFGANNSQAFSSSYAEFGYVTTIINGGLRPWTVCDQGTTARSGTAAWNSTSNPPNPLPTPTNAGPNPHFALWNWLRQGKITQAQYDAYFGTNNGDDGYPTHASAGINAGLNYLSPAQGGGVVHKVNLVDSCGGGSSWRGWVSFDGSNGSTLGSWITDGYPGSVSLTKPSPGCGALGNGDCTDFPGNKNGIAQPNLDNITCPAATPSKNCLVFPVILDNGVTGNGHADVSQSAFIYVILRGQASDSQNNACKGNNGCLLDLEFVNIQSVGEVGSNPSGSITTPKGVQLCGADHDTVANRCAL